MAANRPFPSWRKIEQVLIELLREEGFDIEEFKGDHFVHLYNDGHEEDDEPIEINLGDFARHLEERL
jgi:hypothetical protein